MLDQTEAWKVAKKYAELFGNIPASFTTLIRLLPNDEVKNEGQFSHAAKSQLIRLLRGPSFKSPIYFAAKTFREQEMAGHEVLSSKDLLNFFSPLEMAVLMGVLYLYRKAKRVCDEEEWGYIATPFNRNSELGGHIGLAIPNLGLAIGLLGASAPHFGLAAFLMHDVKSYREYRRHLKLKKLDVDFEFEMAKFGCTHVHIASNLLVALGFGTDFVEAVTIGLEKEDMKCPSKISRAVAVSLRWVDALLDTLDEPKGKHNPQFYPERPELEQLKKVAGAVIDSGSRYFWLNKGKEDISPEATPELFTEIGTQNVVPEEETVIDQGEKEILDELS